ncbi:hypothetical protein, partial [Microcoleus sp. herbarium12]|uniref:hypothetical protein n=1 Tax=Microcoleus sp. herbarium12 TaxID=3055437 RepID=UPI002FD40156
YGIITNNLYAVMLLQASKPDAPPESYYRSENKANTVKFVTKIKHINSTVMRLYILSQCKVT